MTITVTLSYIDASGKSSQWQQNIAAANPADAICRAIDDMEAAGIDIDAVRCLSGIACPPTTTGVIDIMSLYNNTPAKALQ